MHPDDGQAVPLVSIIIVTYGTGPIVLDTVDAVRRHTPVPHEIIVVDNPTDDDSSRASELLRDRTDLVVIEPDRNLGFGGANDLGAERASGEYLCFLNPDAVVGAGWIEPLISALDDPVVAVAGPAFVHPDGSLQEAGQVLYDDSFTAAIGGPELFPGDEAQLFDRDVDYVSAACWLVRRHEHIARGGFDPRYEKAYFEDLDYSLRVERDGQRSRLVSAVRVVHHHGEGSGNSDITVAQASHRVFQSIWTDRIGDQPARPARPGDEFRNRDRLAAHVTTIVAPHRHSTTDRRIGAFSEALEAARAQPRERVTFVTDRVEGLDVESAASAGLEVVVGDVDAVVATRRRHVDTLWYVRSPSRVLAIRPVQIVLLGVVVALLGAFVRSIVLRSPAGLLNADEAYTGIQAFEILRGQFPVVLGGTVYTWPFESYLYAPIVAVFGAVVIPLKLLATLSWVIASGVAYLVGRHMRSPRAGILAGTLIWLTPGALLIISVTAYVSYSSGMLVSLTAFLVALRIVDSPVPRHRTVLVFGVLVGVGFWMHPMFVAVLAPIVLTVVVVHRRRLSVPTAVAAGGVVGCSPLLAWNAVNGWPSLESPADVEGNYFDRLSTFIRDLVPRAFGLKDVTLDWHLGWLGPVLYVLLIALVVVGVVVAFREGTGRSRLLLPVVLVAVLPIMALFSPLIYAVDGRYGIIGFPFVVVAIALGIDALMGRAQLTRSVGVVTAFSVFWGAGLVMPTVGPLADTMGSNPNAVAETVVARLDAAGINYVYGTYWEVHPVDFFGDRRITGGVYPTLPIRFPDRNRAVEARLPSEVAFVFGLANENPFGLLMAAERYDREVIGGTVLYVPRPETVSVGESD